MHTAWDIQIRSGLTAPSTQLAHEQEMLAHCAATDHRPVALIWESGPALVVSQSDRHLPFFSAAVEQSEAAGWPVTVRTSGGTAVPLAPGVINLGLIASWRSVRPTLDAAFQLLCGLLIAAMGDLGVTATIGRAPRAFCDGRCNILVGNRKIAGTSQRQSSLGTRGALLLHAAVVLDADPAMLTAVVARFYEAAGRRVDLSAQAVSSLASVQGRSLAGGLKGAFIAALAKELAKPETAPRWCDTPSSRSSPAATSAAP
jgi:lipoate-protein ligase A